MSRVTVYRWSKYDISTDTERVSRRIGTREAIARHHGTVIEGSAVEIDVALLGAEIDGMTDIKFEPNWTTGEQRQVTA